MKLGDFEINNIYNVDCLVGMKSLPSKCIDLVVTSPPYDDLRNYNGYHFDFENIVKELFRVMKKGGVVVWVVGDKIKNGDRTLTSLSNVFIFRKLVLMYTTL
jgi:site-specific DNA-methyltransferase (adenine-specific)